MKNPWMLDWVDRLGATRAIARGPSADYSPKIRPRTKINMESSEVDRILDKVNQHGVHSLSDEERETLLRISRQG